MNKNYEQDIFGSLKFGRLIKGWRLGILILGIIVSCLAPSMVLIIEISLICLGELECDASMILGMVFVTMFSILLFTATITAYIKNKKHKKLINLWLKDAVKLQASAHRLDLKNPYLYKKNQIEVTFEFNGKLYGKQSFPGNSIIGYTKDFLRYCTGKFEILYSKTYDEVILLNKNK